MTITRQPVVAIIPTGDEIRAADSPLGSGDIVDSNSVMLAARAVQAGAWAAVSDVQPDDPAAIASAVRQATAAADLVLLLAGSSAGRHDCAASVLAQVGAATAHGIAVRPGHPVLLGHARADHAGQVGSPRAGKVHRPGHGAVPVIGVPVLAAMQGCRHPGDGDLRQAVLDCDWTSAPDVEEWIPVALAAGSPAGTLPVASPCIGRGAGALSRLVRADAWWRQPIGHGAASRGDVIEIRPTPEDSEP